MPVNHHPGDAIKKGIEAARSIKTSVYAQAQAIAAERDELARILASNAAINPPNGK